MAFQLARRFSRPRHHRQRRFYFPRCIQTYFHPAAGKTIPLRVEQASTWVRGRRVEVHGPQACAGVTAGLDEYGFLLVRTATGLVTVQTGGIHAAEMS